MTFVLSGQRRSGNYLLRSVLIKIIGRLHALQALFPLRRCPLPARKPLRGFRSLGLLPLLFPTLQGGRGRGRGLRVHLVLCPGGLPPLPLGLGPARGVGVSLDFRLLRASALPHLQLLRELAKGELLGRTSLARSASSAVSPHSSPHVRRRGGLRETSEDRSSVLSSRGSRSLDREARKDKRAHARSVTVAVVLALCPLPVRGREVESVEGGRRLGRCLPVCDHVEIGLGVDALVLRTATDHIVSVRVPLLVGEVGVTDRGHTIPPVALVTVRGHAIDDLPPLTVRGLRGKDDEPDEISRRVVRR